MIRKFKKYILKIIIIKKLKERNNLVIKVSEHKDIIIFTAYYYNERIGHSKTLIKDIENMTLGDIKIESEYQNLGVGSALLKEIIIYCKKNRIKSLSGKMIGKIDKLKQFYTSHGFHISENNIDITF